jgi:hypothetical protein
MPSRKIIYIYLMNSRPINNKVGSSLKKALNRSCPDINDQEANSNTIFTIKEEKEDMSNTYKINLDKDTEKRKNIIRFKSKERIANNSVAKSSSKNPTADKPRARPSSGITRSDYYSNYGTGKSKIEEEKKPQNVKRLSIPRAEIKNPLITDSKPDNKKIFTTPSDNKDKVSKIRTGNSTIKSKLKEIPKAVNLKKKENSSINLI